MTARKKVLNIPVVEGNKTEEKVNYFREINGNILFVLMTLALVVFPQLTTVIKSIGIPLMLLWLFFKDEFYLLLFPVCLFESVWGQLFAGRIGILTIYLLLLVVKIFVDKRITIPVNSNLLPVAFVLFYGLYSFFAIGNNEWLRLVVYVFFACCIMSYVSKSDTLKQQLLFIVLISALANGITMALALNGGESIIEGGEAISFRSWGLGLIDPNYSSFICCLGVAVVMNLPKAKWNTVVAIASLLIFAVGIFRSGSRAGFLCFLILLIVKLFMTGGIIKKILYIAGVALAAFAIFTFIVPRFDFADWTLNRFSDIFDFISGSNIADISGGRTDLFAKYVKYIFSQDLFGLIFGFNILQSDELFGAVGVIHATHNTYLDYILAFGLIGFAILWGLYIVQTVRHFTKRTQMDNAFFMMKLTGLVFSISLSFASRIIWWFLVFI